MKSVKIFKAGNSLAVTVPKELAQKYGLELGMRIFPQTVNGGIFYKPRTATVKISKEFDSWLKRTAKKYTPTLRALAHK